MEQQKPQEANNTVGTRTQAQDLTVATGKRNRKTAYAGLGVAALLSVLRLSLHISMRLIKSGGPSFLQTRLHPIGLTDGRLWVLHEFWDSRVPPWNI